MSGSSAGGGGTGQIGSIGSYMSQGAPSMPTSFGSGISLPGGFVGAPVGLTQGQSPFATIDQILGPTLKALQPGGPLDALIRQLTGGNKKKGSAFG